MDNQQKKPTAGTVPAAPAVSSELAMTMFEGHITHLTDRAAHASASGALANGLAQIRAMVAEHPEWALTAHTLLAAQDERLVALVGEGAGRQVAALMARIRDEIESACSGQPVHRPSTL